MKSTASPKVAAASQAASLADVLYAALTPFGITPRPSGGGQYRIPALWRGSDDFNVAVYPDGSWFDFAHSESGRLADLLERINPGQAAAADIPVLRRMSGADKGRQRDTRIREALRLWKQGAPLLASPLRRVVVAYLAHRGLPESLLPMMAQHSRVLPAPNGGAVLMLPIHRPAAPWPLTGMQRIHLTGAGRKDDANGDPKRMFGPHMSPEGAGGVLLPADRARVNCDRLPLCICEGYETGLAIHAATGYPVYVLYDKDGVRKACIDYIRQLGPHKVIICADNDLADHRGTAAGLDAAMRLSRRLRIAGIRHQVAIPPLHYGGAKGADWLDVWVAEGPATARLLHISSSWRPLHYARLPPDRI